MFNFVARLLSNVSNLSVSQRKLFLIISFTPYFFRSSTKKRRCLVVEYTGLLAEKTIAVCLFLNVTECLESHYKALKIKLKGYSCFLENSVN